MASREVEYRKEKEDALAELRAKYTGQSEQQRAQHDAFKETSNEQLRTLQVKLAEITASKDVMTQQTKEQHHYLKEALKEKNAKIAEYEVKINQLTTENQVQNQEF